jgi:hypothetical protein
MEDNPTLFLAVRSWMGEVKSITTRGSLVVCLGSLVGNLSRLSPQDQGGVSINPTEILFHI